MSVHRRRLFAAATALVATSQVRAETAWPRQSIRLIVPFAPGGTSEIVARTVANELTHQLGQSVFVDNKGGGAGVPAIQEVAKAVPDGHTIVLSHVGSLAVHPFMYSSLPYDVNKDFVPVTLLAKVPNLFVIHPDVPAKSFKEFVAYAKQNPGKLNYGSAGNASAGHLAMEYLKLVTGMFLTHSPYRGTGPTLTDLLAGRTQAFSAGTPALLPHIRAWPSARDRDGHRAAATAAARCALIALKSNSATERFASDSAIRGGGPPEEFAAFIAQQQRVWRDIVVRAGVKPD